MSFIALALAAYAAVLATRNMFRIRVIESRLDYYDRRMVILSGRVSHVTDRVFTP
jgi:hypothetical protein